ncbi:MAG: polysaccharide biosynthesis tyrosine autokinase [Chromatiaceae bacterium]|nr:polysaccharide biosynthesis tyrosine autokinase [Chromatiaceae bacterium]
MAEPVPYLPAQSPSSDAGIKEILRYLWGAWAHKWLIAGMVVLSLTVGIVHFLSTPPVYTATGLMQIEKRGEGLSALQPFEQYDEILRGLKSLAAETRIMRSRTTLAQVAERLKLDQRATPVYYPIIGAIIARHYRGSGVSKPWFGKDEYAWGGEEIEIQTLLLPKAWLRNESLLGSESWLGSDSWVGPLLARNAVLGQRLVLVAGEQGQYSLFDEKGSPLLQGEVGMRAEINLEDGEQLVLFVSRLKARPGTRFQLTRPPLTMLVSGLDDAFSVAEQPPGSGILALKFSAGDPEQAAIILNAIMDDFQRQSVEKKGAEAEQTIQFLEKQLPLLKERVDAAEGAYNAYLQEHRSADLSREAESVLAGVVETESELFRLQQEREGLRERFKPAHPRIQSLDGLIAKLQEKLDNLEKQTQTLPTVQQTALRLRRDVEVNTTLYTQLLTSLQELRMAKAGTVGNARIVDPAWPPTYRDAPNLRNILIAYLGVGFAVGFGIVFLIIRMRAGVDDPTEIERQLGLSVVGIVPFSEVQEKISKHLKKTESGIVPLALAAPEDLAVESIRSLRTVLHFLLLDAANNVLLITGPIAGVGKSFVAVNLAVVLAQAGKRVLLIDADMRKGHLNRLLGSEPGLGLSEYIAGDAPLDKVVNHFDPTGLDFVGTGARPPNPSELLMHDRLAELLHWGLRTHDFVIVDAPPILAVTDAAVIARHGGAALMVVRAGVHPMGEIEESIKRMRQSGTPVCGFVLNGLDTRPRYGYRYGYQYGYRYGYKYGDAGSRKS